VFTVLRAVVCPSTAALANRDYWLAPEPPPGNDAPLWLDVGLGMASIVAAFLHRGALLVNRRQPQCHRGSTGTTLWILVGALVRPSVFWQFLAGAAFKSRDDPRPCRYHHWPRSAIT